MTTTEADELICMDQIHTRACARCGHPSTMIRYHACFCSDYCADRASPQLLQSADAQVPCYSRSHELMNWVLKQLSDIELNAYIQYLAQWLAMPGGEWRTSKVGKIMLASAEAKARAYINYKGLK